MCKDCYSKSDSCFICQSSLNNAQRNLLAEQILSKLKPGFKSFPSNPPVIMEMIWQGELQQIQPQQQHQQQDVLIQTYTILKSKVSIARIKDENTDQPIQNVNWAPSLKIYRIPKDIVQSLGRVFFEKCRKLFFFPRTKDDMETLSTILDPRKNVVGFVHFPAYGNSFKCLILMNYGKASPVQFVGLIPKNGGGMFIQSLRVIVNKAQRESESIVKNSSFSEQEVPVSKKRRCEACCTINPEASRSRDNTNNDSGSDNSNEYIDMSKFLEVQINEEKEKILPFSIQRLLQ
ncbi:MAG: hypothetical protein CXT79_05975 [Thaumarchaeota archaeon]|nr:MAG: hypothetical protein CXT79_05975 [Nitrososphaerota archaeon]